MNKIKEKLEIEHLKSMTYTEINALLNKLKNTIDNTWVDISSNKQPEPMSYVMVKYKDGRKEVAFFDGDNRFYIEKHDSDVTNIITSWHKLP